MDETRLLFFYRMDETHLSEFWILQYFKQVISLDGEIFLTRTLSFEIINAQIKSAPNGFGFDLSIHMFNYSKCGELDVSPHMWKKKERDTQATHIINSITLT